MRAEKFTIVGLALWIGCTVFAGSALANAGYTFHLEHIRSGYQYGPYILQDGERIQLRGQTWRLRRLSEWQIVFEHPDGQPSQGPYQVTPGRIVEIDGQVYTFVRISPSPPGFPVLPPPEDIPPPVARRPVAPVDDGWQRLPGTLGFQPRALRALQARQEPWSRTSMGWELGGGGGTGGGDVSQRSIGFQVREQSWDLSLDRILDARVKGSPVATGIELAALEIDHGSGWRIELGYGFDLYREPNWAFGVSTQIGYSDRSFDLSTTSLTPVSAVESNGVVAVDYAYRTDRSSISLREIYLQAGPDFRVQYGPWGGDVGLSILLVTDISSDARIATTSGRIKLDAYRRHPLSARLGLWREFGPFRILAGMTLGGTQAIELAAAYHW